MVPHSIKRLGQRVRFRPPAAPASLIVRVPDGRAIAVEEYGDRDGPVVLYFHGWPASRLEGGMIADLPVRLLAFDRPGYGRSSSHPNRTLLDWAADVGFVTDRLGIRSFYVVGLSGGAPYAAACAAVLGDRVRGLALVSPVPPPHAVPERSAGVGHLFRLGRYPRLARRLFSLARPLLKQRIITPRTIVGRGLPAADRAMLDRATLATLARVWREGFGRGIDGALSDAEIYARDWGFDLAGIQVPTSLWFGDQDSLIPQSALAPFAAIPGIRTHILKDEGHYSLALRHAHRVLDEMIGEAAAV